MLSFLKKRKRVLLLDDDPSMQRLVQALLSRARYRVDVFAEGEPAIAAIARQPYDALLLDLMTPTKGGITVIRHLRETRPEMIGKVIVVSASPEAVLKTIDPAVFGVIRKPFKPEELIATVDRLVQGR